MIDGFDDPIIKQYGQCLRANNIQIAGIEFIRNRDGEIFTYDVNANTNYNSDAEAAAGKFAMREMARFLGQELQKV